MLMPRALLLLSCWLEDACFDACGMVWIWRCVAGRLVQMPCTSSLSYRWLEDAVTDWQTSQGARVHMGGLAGYTPKQVRACVCACVCVCVHVCVPVRLCGFSRV